MIRALDLRKSFGPVQAIDGVSFEVPEGKVVGLLGPNGAGKSTTMKVMTGFLYADSGSVEIEGHAVDPEDPESKRRVGYLPETTPLYPRMRVAEFLDFVGRMNGQNRAARRDALERVLEDCALAGWERRRIGTLSKGYRQRVGLAQALFADPGVLVLDEPTSGLDPTEITRIRALIGRLGETKTVVLSTHALAEVQETCERVIILAGGRVVADGSTLDLAEGEAVELRVTLAGTRAEEATDALRVLDGVLDVRVLAAVMDERVHLALALADDESGARRWNVASAVTREVAARGWELFELRHELPSLERVFLSRTETRSRVAEVPEREVSE